MTRLYLQFSGVNSVGYLREKKMSSFDVGVQFSNRYRMLKW
jgi:hypothetical protein